MIIKVAEAKIEDSKNKKITLELTQDEAVSALVAIDMVCEKFQQEIDHPTFATRRAIRRGMTSEKSLRERHRTFKRISGKISSEIVGANADELEAAIKAVQEGKNE